MQNNKTVIFDYGGVISKPQNAESILKIIKKLGLRDNDHFKTIYSIYRKDIDSGLLSLKEYWAKTLSELNLEFSGSDFDWLIREDIVSWADVNEETVDLIKELKQKGIKLAILSNMVTETLDYLRKNTSFIPLFDFEFFSCDINMIKPNPGLYKYVLDRMKVKAEDCIFIDDITVNCQAAENLGIKTVQFVDVRQLKTVLETLLE